MLLPYCTVSSPKDILTGQRDNHRADEYVSQRGGTDGTADSRHLRRDFTAQWSKAVSKRASDRKTEPSGSNIFMMVKSSLACRRAQGEGLRDKQCEQTYGHELGAGSHKLSETEQEVFLCGQNLSQLQSGGYRDRESCISTDTDIYNNS